MGKLIERKSNGLRMSLPRSNSLASEMLKRKRHAREAAMVRESTQVVSPSIGIEVESDQDVSQAISPMRRSKIEDDYDLFDVDGPIFQILAGVIAIVAIPVFLGVDVYRTIRKNIRNTDHEKTDSPEAAREQLEPQVDRADSPENSVFNVYIDQDANQVGIDEAGNKMPVFSLESQHTEVYDEGEASINERPVAEGGEVEVRGLPSNSTIERLRILEHAEKKNRDLKLTLETEILSLPNEERNNSVNPANAAFGRTLDKTNDES